MKKGMNLDELSQKVAELDSTKKDFIFSTEDLIMTSEGNLELRKQGEMPVSPHSHIQISAHTKIPYGYYSRLLKEDPDLLSINVNRAFNSNPTKRMVRTQNGQVRAFLSEKYKIVDNKFILDTALPAIRNMGGVEITSCYVNDNMLFIKAVSEKLVSDIKVGDPVQFGFSLSNSEIGLSMVRCLPLIYRLICTNGMISPIEHENNLRKRHLGRKNAFNDDGSIIIDTEFNTMSYADIGEKITTALTDGMQQSKLDMIVKKLQVASKIQLDNDHYVGIIEAMGKENGLQKHEKVGIYEALKVENDDSLTGLAHAITRFAQNDGLSYERASFMEKLGWDIANTSATHVQHWIDLAPKLEEKVDSEELAYA